MLPAVGRHIARGLFLLPWIGFASTGCRSDRTPPAGNIAAYVTPLAPRPAATPAPARPHTEEIGRSVEGRPLTLFVFGEERDGAPLTLILGGIHGNEPAGAGVCRELVRYLTDHPEACAGRRVAVLPEANPDGLLRRLRTNKNLVDLNRNFPAKNWAKTRRSSFFGGDAPATQPETVALVALIERLKPAGIISVHAMDQPCNNYDGPAEEWARRMALLNGYPVRASIGYPTPGSLGSWAGIDRKIPTITLELREGRGVARSWDENREALLDALAPEGDFPTSGSGPAPRSTRSDASPAGRTAGPRPRRTNEVETG